jgi:hypothetical protein
MSTTSSFNADNMEKKVLAYEKLMVEFFSNVQQCFLLTQNKINEYFKLDQTDKLLFRFFTKSKKTSIPIYVITYIRKMS